MSATLSPVVPHILSNLLAPVTGKTHTAMFTFALNGQAATINWPGMQQAAGAWIPQAACVDNYNSSNAVVFEETSTGYTETIPAGFKRTFQFPAVATPIFTLTAASGAAAGELWLYDWPAFPDSSFNPSSSGGQSAVSIVGQPISVVVGGTEPPPSPVTYLAATGATTITAAGTSQTLFAAGDIITGAYVTNPANATESLFIDPTGGVCTVTPAGTTFEIAPGSSFTLGPAANNVTVNAVTIGHAFSAATF